jgi:hypothetical protein
MESMSDCGSVLPVAQLMERAILIVTANRNCFECLIELQWTDPWGMPESTSEGIE